MKTCKPLSIRTPEQIRALPELRGLEARESRQDLPAILRAVGEHVDAFFEDFPDTSSTEQVRSGPCDNPSSDRCRVKFRDKFSYLVITNPRGGDQPLGEYRSDAKGRPIDYRRLGNGKVILTYGFTTAPLQHFRPQYQEGCRFRLFGRQSVMGREADVVGFTEIPGRYPTADGVPPRKCRRAFVSSRDCLDRCENLPDSAHPNLCVAAAARCESRKGDDAD